MLANQIRPTTLSAAIIVFRVHPFLAKKHRELPFLAIAQSKTTKMKQQKTEHNKMLRQKSNMALAKEMKRREDTNSSHL